MNKKSNNIYQDNPIKNIKMISINWHMTERCNYRCKFCFAKYNVKEKPVCENLNESKKLIRLFKKFGAKKITFTGGEPLLCKNLGELVKFAKKLGITTSIVTNGYYLTEPLGLEFLENYSKYIDWIGMSIDSQYEEIEKSIGRGFGDHVKRVKSAVKIIKNNYSHIKIKINTVVFKYNWKEDMHDLIKELNPERWKVFQVMIIKNLNEKASDIKVTKNQFMDFVKRHEDLNPIWEDNNLMTDSYVMVDPLGRFFNCDDCMNNPRKSILKCNLNEAIYGLRFDYKKFNERNGIYNW